MEKQFMALINTFLKPIKDAVLAPILEILKLLKQKLDIKKHLGEAGKKVSDTIKKILAGKPEKVEDYIRLGKRYYAKKLLAMILVVAIGAAFFAYKYALPVLVSQFGTATFVEAAKEITDYSGKVKIINNDDDRKTVYTGRLKDGKKTGKGKLFSKNGTLIYEGEFLEDKYSGQGVLYDDTGVKVYKGNFLEDKKSGTGTEYYPDGNIKYTGSFKDGNYDGNGILRYKNKNVRYEGTFANGLYEGEGALYSDEAKPLYKGTFVKDKYSGKGTLYDFAGNLLYEGTFEAGEYKGNGKLYYSNGELRYKGAFEMGKFSGEGFLFDEKKNLMYVGMFFDGEYHGTGKLFKDGKLYYEGEFSKGMFEGTGRMYETEADTLLYEGEFKNNGFNGKGQLYNQDGKLIYTGAFLNNSINFGYLIGRPVEDVEAALGKEIETLIFEEGFNVIGRELGLSAYLDFNTLDKESSVQELTLWGERNVYGISKDMTLTDLAVKLGEPLRKEWEPVQEKDDSALGNRWLDKILAAEYKLGKYMVTFCYEKEDSGWLYAVIRKGIELEDLPEDPLDPEVLPK